MNSPRWKEREANMKTNKQTTDRNHRDGRQYALRRGLGFWELTFEGKQAIFKHEQGALYVACLLLDPPSEPIHALALALKAKEMSGSLRAGRWTRRGEGKMFGSGVLYL
jgi:hypothetical protein